MKKLSVNITDEQMEYLKKLSHYLSLERDQDLNVSDLTKEALENTFSKDKFEKQINKK